MTAVPVPPVHTPDGALTPSSQDLSRYVPDWARRCLDNRCYSTRQVVLPRRRNHLYESPVPNPTRDYPCLACGRLRVDWPHRLWPPAATTHIVQCLDCDLVITVITVPAFENIPIPQGERPC